MINVYELMRYDLPKAEKVLNETHPGYTINMIDEWDQIVEIRNEKGEGVRHYIANVACIECPSTQYVRKKEIN